MPELMLCNLFIFSSNGDLMAKFAVKSFFFLIIGFLILNFVISPIVIKNYRMIYHHGKWAKQAYVLKKCQQKLTTNYIILGDSVTNQLYSAFKHPASFAANGATLVSGQYILAMNIFKKNPHLRAIFLMHPPFILNYHFWRKKTYRNFLIPFFTLKNKRYFTPTILAYLKERPLAYLALLPYFKITNLISDVKFKRSQVDKSKKFLIQPYAIEYYKKFQQFSKKYGVLVKFITLHSKNGPKQKYGWIYEKICQQIKAEGLEDILGGMCTSLRYGDDNHFADFLHLKKELIPQYKKIYDKTLSKELARLRITF